MPNIHQHLKIRISPKNANDPVPTWEELPLPRNGWLSDVDFDFDNPDITYISYGSASNLGPNATGTEMVYRMDYSNPSIVSSYNCTNHPCATVCTTGCTDLTQNLPSTGVGNDALAVEKGSDGGLYLATDFGVYYTNNKYLTNGSGWQKFGADLPNVQCAGIEINYVINKIRIGLYGRGIWEHDLFCPSDYDLAFTTSTSSNLSNTFQEAENNITVTANTGNINLTNFTARAGNEIVITATGNNEVVIGPNSHLFIHACNHPGNSFRQAPPNNSPQQNSSSEISERPITQSDNFKFTYYPNPFTDHLHIDFLLEKNSPVQVSMYNSMGQLIEILAKGNYDAGEHTLLFNNPSVKPGLYFVRMDLGEKHYTKAVLKSAE